MAPAQRDQHDLAPGELERLVPAGLELGALGRADLDPRLARQVEALHRDRAAPGRAQRGLGALGERERDRSLAREEQRAGGRVGVEAGALRLETLAGDEDLAVGEEAALAHPPLEERHADVQGGDGHGTVAGGGRGGDGVGGHASTRCQGTGVGVRTTGQGAPPSSARSLPVA